MKSSILLTLLTAFSMLCSCNNKGSILTQKVEKDPGRLTVLNKNGFLGATVAGTSIDHVLQIKAIGGLTLREISATLQTNDPIEFKGGSYPGAGGTCSDTLDSGDVCTVIINYAPENTDSHLATLKISYKDALKTHQLNYELSADSHPILSFEYGTVYDFNNKFLGTSTDLKVKITNVGRVVAENITVNNLAAPFSMKGGSYPGVGGNCGTRLVPGEACQLLVNYSPTTNGEHLQNITLNYLNTGRPETNTLKLLAWGFAQAVLTVSDASGHDFGTVATEHPHTKTFIVTHSGGDVEASALNAIGLSGPFSFPGGTFPGGGSCKSTLGKQLSCTFVVQLSANTSSDWNGSLTFSYFNGTHTIPVLRPLSGKTRSRPILTLTPSGEIDFGIVQTGTSETRSFTITHSGELPATNLRMAEADLRAPFTYAGGTFPGTGGTCTTTLSSGSCTIVLAFSSTTPISDSLETTLTYFNTVQTPTLRPKLSLKALTEGRVQTAQFNNGSFGVVVLGQSKDKTISITATAGSPNTQLLPTITGPFAFKGDSYPGTGGNCGSTLNPGSTCSMVLTYTPTAAGSQTGELKIDYNNGLVLTNHIIGLSGQGSEVANMSLPDEIDFGTTSVNSFVLRTITLTNSTSVAPTGLTVISKPAGFHFRGTTGNFPGTGGTCNGFSVSCTIVMYFHPTAPGDWGGLLKLSYQDGGGNTKFVETTLKGVGVVTNDLFLSEFDNYSYGTRWVGQPSTFNFTLHHGGGNTAALINTKNLSLPAHYSLASDNCPTSLNNGGYCTLGVKFDPTSAGLKSSTLSVSYDNGTEKTVSRLFSGTGRVPAIMTFSPTSFDFGANPTDRTYEKSFTLTNIGEYEANSVSLSGSSGSGFTWSHNCPSRMPINTSCVLNVLFSPTSAINYGRTISLSFNNGFTTATNSLSITGSGLPTAVLSFAAGTYDFGKLIQTQSTSKTITVNHSGPVVATGLSTTALSSSFSFKGGSYPGTGGTCGETLSSGSCTMVIDFSPTTTGIKTHTLKLSYQS